MWLLQTLQAAAPILATARQGAPALQFIGQFKFARSCISAIRSHVRRLRWVYSVLLMTTGMVLLLLDVGGCGKQRPAGGLSKLKPCRLAGIDEELLCGKLTVLENRKTRTGRTIDLNIVVLPAFDQNTKAEPLFDLAGGPGASSGAAAGVLSGF